MKPGQERVVVVTRVGHRRGASVMVEAPRLEEGSVSNLRLSAVEEATRVLSRTEVSHGVVIMDFCQKALVQVLCGGKG